ncbi:MAG: hypothetical protein R2746_06190 [Acidimicrobiales bacterium]
MSIPSALHDRRYDPLDPTASFAAAAAHLFEAVADVAFDPNMAHAPTVSEAEVAALGAPVAELAPELVARFALRAGSSWGTAEDLRRVAPRALVLAADHALPLDRTVLWERLRAAGWPAWPDHQVEAVARFLRRWARLVRSEPRPAHAVHRWLPPVSSATHDLRPVPRRLARGPRAAHPARPPARRRGPPRGPAARQPAASRPARHRGRPRGARRGCRGPPAHELASPARPSPTSCSRPQPSSTAPRPAAARRLPSSASVASAGHRHPLTPGRRPAPVGRRRIPVDGVRQASPIDRNPVGEGSAAPTQAVATTPWCLQRPTQPPGLTRTARRVPHVAQNRGGSSGRPHPAHSAAGRPQLVQCSTSIR